MVIINDLCLLASAVTVAVLSTVALVQSSQQLAEAGGDGPAPTAAAADGAGAAATWHQPRGFVRRPPRWDPAQACSSVVWSHGFFPFSVSLWPILVQNWKVDLSSPLRLSPVS